MTMTLEQVRDSLRIFERNGTVNVSVEKVRKWADAIDAHLIFAHTRAELAECRQATANALLRDTLRYLDPRHYDEAIKNIEAHLQGSGDEA